MTQQEWIKKIEERAGKYCTPHGHKNPEHYAYKDGATSTLPEIEALEAKNAELEKRVKELEGQLKEWGDNTEILLKVAPKKE